jgi:transcriptional regulator with XRE-family HTH domain
MLVFDLAQLMKERLLTAAQVEAGAQLSRGVIAPLLRGDSKRIVRLSTLVRLATFFRVGIAPAAPVSDKADTPTKPVPPLLVWASDNALRWNVGAANAKDTEVLGYWEAKPYELMIGTGKFPNTIYPICEGRTERAGLDVIAAIAQVTQAPVGGPPPGVASEGFLLRWELDDVRFPHIAEVKAQIVHQAAHCRVDGCHEQPVARDLCLNHYMQVRAGRPIEELRPAVRKAAKRCTWKDEAGEQCPRAASVGGFCVTHYRKHRRQEAEKDAKRETTPGDHGEGEV